MRQKTARCISIIGHPFLTIPAFIFIVLFVTENFLKALLLSVLIVGCVIIPTSIRNYIKTKKGEYTNFDVSVKTQRNSMYLFAFPPFCVLTFILFATGQSKSLCMGVLFGLILLIISYVVNFFIKCSAHVSLTIFLAFLIIPINFIIGIIVLLFSGLMGWSRIELKRHTIKEVFAGAVIGLLIGITMLIA